MSSQTLSFFVGGLIGVSAALVLRLILSTHDRKRSSERARELRGLLLASLTPAYVCTSPDCGVGKHDACNGDAWDHSKDEPTVCVCVCHR